MATVTFLWHLHQPAYRTADGFAHAPWVALHAGGVYTTLLRAILDTGGGGQVVNLVPTLLEQLAAYRDGTVTDKVVEAITRPAGDLTAHDRTTLVEWAFHVTPRQMERFPRLRDLASRRPASGSPRRLASLYGPGDLRDLQVLFVLAIAGEQAWRDEGLASLYEKGRHFSTDEQQAAARWLGRQSGELMALLQAVATLPGVEIATSPYAHPIIPLLVDSAIVRASWAPHPAPRVPEFAHPEDARTQIEKGLAYMRHMGLRPAGCWPPEGSVSEEAVALYADAGVRWLVTDEGILDRSLGHPLRGGDRVPTELYSPWRLATPSPAILFRDRWLSDRIGFVYGHWDDEVRAAGDLVEHLLGLARSLPSEASIVVALDGENPWLHYPQGGGVFLRELLAVLQDAGPELQPATCSDVVDRRPPEVLQHLHPGSWIESTFATWIGHPEKTRAWEVLMAVRDAATAGGRELPPSLLLAEGSDWFWWLGDDNPTPLAPLYDRIFRDHLRDACAQAGIEPPVDLEQPLKTVTQPQRVPISSAWRSPVLDGRVTSYYEWSLASWLEGGDDHPLRRLALWGSDRTLYVLVEGRVGMPQLTETDRLIVVLRSPEGESLTATLPGPAPDAPGARIAVARVAELALPWTAAAGYRLEVRLGASQLPDGAVLLIEPFHVDE